MTPWTPEETALAGQCVLDCLSPRKAAHLFPARSIGAIDSKFHALRKRRPNHKIKDLAGPFLHPDAEPLGPTYNEANALERVIVGCEKLRDAVLRLQGAA